MPRTKATARRNAGRQSTTHRAEDTRADDGFKTDPEPGTQHVRQCPFGQHETNATYKLGRDGELRWFVGCRPVSCPGSHSLPDLAEALGLDGGASPERIAEAIWLLDSDGSRRRPAASSPARLPTGDEIREWAAALTDRDDLAMRPVRRYLHRERGLTAETIRREWIGYAPKGTGWGVFSTWAAFTLPVFDAAGEVVNLRRRFWPRVPMNGDGRQAKMVGLRDRGSQLYPRVPRGRSVVVCEGEFDALLLRQAGLAAVTSTAGTGWDDEWDALFRGKRVAVLYDCGEASLAKAERRASDLRAAGARAAWAADLGLSDGEDVTDYLVTYGRTAAELREAIRRSS